MSWHIPNVHIHIGFQAMLFLFSFFFLTSFVLQDKVILVLFCCCFVSTKMREKSKWMGGRGMGGMGVDLRGL